MESKIDSVQKSERALDDSSGIKDFNLMVEDYNLDREEKKFHQTAKNIFPSTRPFSSQKSTSDRFIPGTFDIDNVVDYFRPGDSFETQKNSDHERATF